MGSTTQSSPSAKMTLGWTSGSRTSFTTFVHSFLKYVTARTCRRARTRYREIFRSPMFVARSLTSSSVGTTRFPKTGSQWVTKSAASFPTTPSAGAMASAPLRISSAHLCPTSASTDSLSPKTWRTTSSRCARLILTLQRPFAPRDLRHAPQPLPLPGDLRESPCTGHLQGHPAGEPAAAPGAGAAPKPAGGLHRVWSEEAVRGEAAGPRGGPRLRFPEEGQAVPPHALERGHVLDVRQEEAL